MRSAHSDRLVTTGNKRDWLLSQPRPLTLLVACGVMLSAVLLIVTGLVAGYLRQQTLESSEAELLRLGAVLVAAGDSSLLGVDAVLKDVTSRLSFPGISTPDEIASDIRGPAVTHHLNHRTQAAESLDGIALIGADGTVIRSAGNWPVAENDVAGRDYFVAMKANPQLTSYVGAPYPSGSDNARVIPVARKLPGAGGAFAGLAVAALRVGEFENLYRAVPLGGDSVISLIRSDGAVLAQFPSSSGTESRAPSAPVLAALAGGTKGVFEDEGNENGGWYIDAVQPLADYPLAIVVSRDGRQALVGWTRQAMMFGAFAIFGVMTIGLTVFLIGRQIHTHNALTAMRAEKIEVEHARLLAEAELLKKERFSVLGQFTATVASELRNPLSAIRNTLFTMREIAATSGLILDRPIARVQRSIARCDRIIGDLLEYIRSPELSRAPINFDDWLHEVLLEHGLPPTVTLVEEYDAGGAIVRVDADRIRRVVINLIDNAAQALGEMPPGGGPLRIAVRSAIGDGGLELTVADTGPGIAQENLTRIFEPLFSTKSFGAGLGLATVKQIVDQHGGEISIESTLGVGTSVTVRLPVEQVLKVAA
jgi:signal transduction histidine kinase